MITKEQAKKRGFTHIDKYGDYWKVNGDVAHFLQHGKIFRYAFTDVQQHIKNGDIKPI